MQQHQHAPVLDSKVCLICCIKLPTLGMFCARCERAQNYVLPTGQHGDCQVCIKPVDLWESDYLPREWQGCFIHTTIGTALKISMPDFSHIGDVRNVA